ncbi:MAG: hypothetical protein IV100_15085 [Myxococcales bacterium]|nr:hypothetical protein [Myxococcales bacterium]
MTSLWLAALLASCSAPETTDRASQKADPAAPRRLSPEAERVYQMTLERDAPPPCSQLARGLKDAPAALLEVAETVTAPPWSAVRAATCLVRHHAASVEPALLRWVHERETMGLGLVTLNHLKHVEPALAARLIAAARSGEYAEAAERRIARVASAATPPGGGVLQK